MPGANPLRMHVHDDTRVLDAMLRLVDLANGARAIDDTLAAMCRQIADVAGVEVVSVYMREQQATGDVLVMRGNVGFPADAVGRVQLGIHEGLTGVVAERRRAVSVAVAQADERYKHVDGIGEEQFAAYLGVPLLVADEVAGVLVLQRRAPGAFDDDALALASSLTAPLVLVLGRERARSGQDGARLLGHPLARGRASGRVVVLPPPAEQPTSETAALHALEFDVVAAGQRLGHARPAVLRALDNLGLFAIALREHLSVGPPRDDVIAALERVPYHAASGAKDLRAVVDERRREVAALWAFLVADMQHHLSIGGGVLVVPQLGSLIALEAVARGAAAVITGTSAEGSARTILEAAQIPAVERIGELAALACGNVVEVDGTRGTVRIVPERRSE